jgi:hypothetical protein
MLVPQDSVFENLDFINLFHSGANGQPAQGIRGKAQGKRIIIWFVSFLDP